tara:strand:- start:3176 stop:3427 length:252 start_codon:yes stop_codon:yes gene_type:complete
MTKTVKEIIKINDKLWDIFHEHGGYEYNDEMIWQLEGYATSIDEMEEDETDHVLKEGNTTLEYFEWVVKMIELKESEPPQLYC